MSTRTEILHHTEQFLNTFTHIPTTILAISFGWLTIEYMPTAMSVFWLVTATLLDLFTGLLKAWASKQYSSSIGFRRTLTKIGSYCSIVIVVTVFINIIGTVDRHHEYNLGLLINSLIGMMIFVELFSCLENVSIAFPDSPMIKMFVKPLMKFLRGRIISSNPLNKIKNEEEK